MVEEIDPETINQLLSNGDDFQIIDVRQPDAYRAGHLPGAINIPIDQFIDEIPERDWGNDIILICPHGESSRQAGRLLESYADIGPDVRVANVTGGYEAWPYELEQDE